METPDRTIWVITSTGVAWFDHFRWHPVTEGLGQSAPTSLCTFDNNDIAVVVNDRIYRGNRNGFRRLPCEFEGRDLIVSGIVSQGEGRLWLEAHGRHDRVLSLYEWTGGKLTLLVTPGSATPIGYRQIWRTACGRTWLTTQEGLFRCNDATTRPLQWESVLPNKFGWFTIRCLAETRDGRGIAQVSHPRDAAALFSWGVDGVPQRDSTSPGEPFVLMDINDAGDIIGIRETAELVLREKGQWKTVWALQIRTPLVNFLKFTSGGNLWIGTQDGLMLYRTAACRWNYWPPAEVQNGLYTHAIMQAHDGTIWLATRLGVEHRRLDGSLIDRFDGALGESFINVTTVGEDEQHRIWVGSGSGFTGCFRYEDHTWTRFDKGSELAGAYVHQIYRDRRGRLWFAALGPMPPKSRSEGPGVFLLKGDQFEQWGIDQGLPCGRVYCVFEGVDGAFWFGTSCSVSRYDRGHWTHWDRDRGLRISQVFCITQALDGQVWFGQQGGGIGSIRSDGTLHYVDDEGLASHKILWDMKADAKGTIWASSDMGLCCYRDGEWFDLGGRTGVGNGLIWPILPLGESILLGTMGRGVAVLKPDEADRVTPKVEITPRIFENSTAWLRWAVFPFEGATPAQLLETRYQVDSEPWSNWSRARDVEFGQLARGQHQFRVQARGVFGEKTDPGPGATFYLPPPIYLRRQVMIPVGLLGLTAAGLALALLKRRRREARALAESELRIQSILDHTPAVIFIKAVDGKYQFVNRRFEALFHVSREAIKGKTDFEVFPPEIAEAFRRNDVRVARDQSAELVEEQAPQDDGMHTYISAKFPLVDAKGQTTAVCGIATDITPRKITEEKLAERVEHAALSAKVATAFSREGALSAILTRSASAMIDHLGASGVRIWTLDNENSFQLQTHVQRDGRHLPLSAGGDSRAGPSMASNPPEATSAPLIQESELGGVTARYSLIVQSRVVGVMVVEFEEAPNEATGGTIQSVADTIAAGIERFRVTEALLHEQTFLKTLLTSVSEGIVACDAQGNLTLFNKALREMHGQEPGTFGSAWEGPLEIFDAATGHPLHRSELPLMRALRGEEVQDAELVIRRPDGTERSCLSSGRPMVTVDGRALGAVVAVRDVTQRRQAENSLRYSEARLRATLEQAAVGISETDPAGHYLLVNQRFCDIVGYTQEELLGRRFQDITFPEDLEGDVVRFRKLLNGEIDRYALEKRYIRKDNTPIWVSLTVSAVRTTAKKPGYVIAVIEDITQRRRAEEAIRRQALVVENIMDGVLVLNGDEVITDCNPAAEQMFGYGREALVGRSPEMLNHPLEGPLVTAAIHEGLRTSGRWSGEVRFVRPDGTEGLSEVVVVPLLNERHQQIGTVAVNRDITARKRAEEEKALLQAKLFQTQKMEAVGTLARGIAHDFAHLLSAISTMTELTRGMLPVNHPAGVSLDHLNQAAKHSQGVVRALLTYSHRGPLVKAMFNVKSTINGAVEVARSLRMPPTIELSTDTDSGADAWVLGDEMLIRQAIINLALNARDAMPNGGQFRVALTRDPARPGYIQICAEDTGLGMTGEVKARVFEPYFTTKPRDEASGLGMALIHSIVTGHGGAIEIHSEPGRGTRIFISLPCSESAPLPEPIVPLASGQILVIVAAEQVRSIITSALRSRGYEVRAEGRLSEAEHLLSNGDSSTRLVILDLPPTAGRKLARLSPDLDARSIRRLVLHDGNDEANGEPANPLVSRLCKPFEISELLDAVAAALLDTLEGAAT